MVLLRIFLKSDVYFLLLTVSITNSLAQNDTTYYTEKEVPTTVKKDIAYYSILKSQGDTKIDYWYYESGELYGTVQKVELKYSLSKEGSFAFYYKDGNVKNKGTHNSNKFTGTYSSFYKNGQPEEVRDYGLPEEYDVAIKLLDYVIREKRDSLGNFQIKDGIGRLVCSDTLSSYSVEVKNGYPMVSALV